MDKCVYLAGPMVGLSKEEMTGWRTTAAGYTSAAGILSRDPTRRVPFGNADDNQYSDLNYAKFIFEKDLKDIDDSQILLADCRLKSGRAMGTNMELMYAWTHRKPIVAWVGPQDPPHPFLMHMAMCIVYELHDAIDATIEYLNA